MPDIMLFYIQIRLEVLVIFLSGCSFNVTGKIRNNGIWRSGQISILSPERWLVMPNQNIYPSHARTSLLPRPGNDDKRHRIKTAALKTSASCRIYINPGHRHNRLPKFALSIFGKTTFTDSTNGSKMTATEMTNEFAG